jgi:hypothetical protein
VREGVAATATPALLYSLVPRVRRAQLLHPHSTAARDSAAHGPQHQPQQACPFHHGCHDSKGCKEISEKDRYDAGPLEDVADEAGKHQN